MVATDTASYSDIVSDRDSHPTALGLAFAEYGRIARTLHLLAFVDPADAGYRHCSTRSR